ncbi:TPA: hypothetical protein ACT2IM_002065 [Streptococcus suis]
MLQPVVPLTVPKSCRFEKKSRNDILMKIRLGKTKVTFFQSIDPDFSRIFILMPIAYFGVLVSRVDQFLPR